MARTKATLGAGARLSDYLSASLLARVYPAEQVHQILDEHGVNSKRVRNFPAVATTYYCMALSLYPEAAYEDVFAAVAQGLSWMQGSRTAQAVMGSSLASNLSGKILITLPPCSKIEVTKDRDPSRPVGSRGAREFGEYLWVDRWVFTSPQPSPSRGGSDTRSPS